MTTKEFSRHIENTFKECLVLAKKKNADYAGKEDPFKNFDSVKLIGVDAKHGIMVRLMDKITRIGNLLEKEPKVVEEKIEDTINDGINYLAILKAKIHDENR